MFSLARADAWSPGDLALQHAVKDALLLEERPSPVEMNEVAEAWRPWRGVAARLLWSYYALRRKSSPSPLGGEALTRSEPRRLTAKPIKASPRRKPGSSF
jgi:3-methyladenine DNA glycosylase/8-oxoguanine DNA glycosylase